MSIFSNSLKKMSNTASGVYKSSNPNLAKVFGKGFNLSEESKLTLSAYYAAVNIKSNHVATLPVNIFKDSTGSTLDTNHYLNNKLKHQPNSETNAFNFKKILLLNSMIYGNGFARIERESMNNKVTGLYLEKPSDTFIKKEKASGKVYYRFSSQDSKDSYYRSDEVIHIYPFGLDGYEGLSLLEVGARKSFENHKSVQNFERKYFDSYANIGGILTTEDNLSNITDDEELVEEYKDDIRSEFDKIYAGDENTGKTAILEGNWDYEKLDVKATDAQIVERTKATVEDISRWTHVPLSYLSQPDQQSYSSRESESKAYVQNALTPHLKQLENELRNKLFTNNEKQQGYKVNFDTKDLIKASMEDTSNYVSNLVDRGIFTINQAKDFLNIPTEEGFDFSLKQKNMDKISKNGEIEGNNE